MKGKYTVISPLHFNGKAYEPGKIVELDEETAEPLLDRVVKAATPEEIKASDEKKKR
jgi:hypothetical protein